jgi:hypothetical protein
MSTHGSHLDPTVASLLKLPDDERIRALLADRFICHEKVGALLAECDYLAHRPPSLRPRGLLVCAPSGSGKTAFANALVRRYACHPATRLKAATKPVLLISMVNARDAEEIYRRLLEDLGCQRANRYTGKERRSMTLELTRAANVQMVIFDEVQDLLNITPRQRVLALMGIKDLMNSLLLPIVALGTQESRFALESDQHLHARFAFRALPVWESDDYFRHFLESFESSLPLKRRSNLGSLTMMRSIIKATQGRLADIVWRLQIAAALAVGGEERVTPDLFHRSAHEFPTIVPAPSQRRKPYGP